jgi:prephenate dehydrogenase
MTPAEHDTHLAAVSHVPHLMSCLVALQADEDSQDLAGSGWRDITRVAAGDPPMWTAICKENRHAIEKELSAVSDSLAELRNLIETSDDDGLCQWLAEAKKIRNQAFQ